MKKWIVVVLIFLISVTAAYTVGYHVREQKQTEYDTQACQTYLSFAIQKCRNEDMSNPDSMEALISNVYAAWSHCPDPDAANQLHRLWNTLIFTYEDYTKQPDILMEQLNGISAMLSKN